jgi:hypothetical protein
LQCSIDVQLLVDVHRLKVEEGGVAVHHVVLRVRQVRDVKHVLRRHLYVVRKVRENYIIVKNDDIVVLIVIIK